MSTPDEEHDYIEQGPFCLKFLTALQAKTHNCSALFNGVREIPVLYYYEVPDSEEKTVIAHGHDGIMYRLIQCLNPLNRNSSDDSHHEPRNRRKVTRTSSTYI
jgi:hypothetical protein